MTVAQGHFAFLVDKTFVVGRVEELVLGADVASGATSITIDTAQFQDGGTAFSAALPGEFVIRDTTGAAGSPNAEIITISAYNPCTQAITCSAIQAASGYKKASGASILTPGYEMALVNADFNCRLRGVSCAPKIEEDDANSKYATGDHGEDPSVSGARSIEISFSDKIALPSLTDFSTMPVWEKFKRGMGCEVVVYPTHGREYFPMASADNTTMTLWYIYIENAAKPRATAFASSGCKGTGDDGAAGIGKPYMLNAKFTGKWTRTSDLTNAQILALTSPETGNPEKMLSNSVTTNFGSANVMAISQFKIDFGNTVQPLVNQADPTGYDYYSITDRKPRLTCDPIMKQLANENFDSLVAGQTVGTIQIMSALVSPHITFNMPVCQLETPAQSAQGMYVSQNRTYRLLRNVNATGGQNLSLPAEAAWSMLVGTRS